MTYTVIVKPIHGEPLLSLPFENESEARKLYESIINGEDGSIIDSTPYDALIVTIEVARNMILK